MVRFQHERVMISLDYVRLLASRMYFTASMVFEEISSLSVAKQSQATSHHLMHLEEKNA